MNAEMVIEQFIQLFTDAICAYPELTVMREPIHAALSHDRFRELLGQFLGEFGPDLVEFPAAQAAIVDYLLAETETDLAAITRHYGRQPLQPQDISVMQKLLREVRYSLRADPIFGPLLVTRDSQVTVEIINSLPDDMHHVRQLLTDLLQNPAINAEIRPATSNHIFLSYSRQNLIEVAHLRNALEAAGYTVWQDTTAIKGGAEWIRSIEEGIDRAFVVVSVVSRAATNSEWVQIEFLHAKRRNKPIVPIKVDDVEIPTMMLTINVIMDGYPDLDKGIQILLQNLPDSRQTAVPLSAPAPAADPRQPEISYLDRVLLEYSIWQTVYTPMAGVARLRQTGDKKLVQRAGAKINMIFGSLQKGIRDTFVDSQEVVSQPFEDIVEAVNKVRRLVLLGDPGSGKTTTLWKLAADYAEIAKQDASAPLPLFLRLGELPPVVSLRQQLREQLGDLSLDQLMAQGRLALLIDGLNELPAENRDAKVAEVQALVSEAKQHNLIIAVSCRQIDYQGELDLRLDEQVQIAPLDPARIRQFCVNHLPQDGDNLFWQLAGGREVLDAWQTWQSAGATFDQFWSLRAIPRENPPIYGRTTKMQDMAWRRAVLESQRTMLSLARNPYMLFMITQVYAETASMPENRGKLFELFTNYLLLEREGMAEDAAAALAEQLAELAYTMQRDQQGTGLSREQVAHFLSDDMLYRALSATLLDGGVELRFTHQLLQEYFAAQRLNRDMLAGIAASHFWPEDRWWQPQGWEETAVLLAGLYHTDVTPLVEWLRDAQPELTARAILESGAYAPPTTVEQLGSHWKPRLENEADPAARAAVGRALGLLNLDDRPGVGLSDDGRSLLEWIEIPGALGETFLFGDGEQTRRFSAEMPLLMACYPVTNAQFETFILDRGYQRREFWTAVGWEHKERGGWTQPRFWDEAAHSISNHPVIGVSWHEAMAFARWLDTRLPDRQRWDGLEVRLPTEAEWERGTRYPDGRKFPWGERYVPGCANIDETANRAGPNNLRRTSAVGLYPQGNSALGIADLAGNVWEWCLTKWASPYPPPAYLAAEDDSVSGDSTRVVRGGSYLSFVNGTRATFRSSKDAFSRGEDQGFRLVIGPVLLK